MFICIYIFLHKLIEISLYCKNNLFVIGLILMRYFISIHIIIIYYNNKLKGLSFELVQCVSDHIIILL